MTREAGDELPLVEHIRRAVRDCGLSLNELGRRAGVSQPQLSRFLLGQRTLTLPAAARVCQYLGLRLVGRDEPPEPEQPGRAGKPKGGIGRRPRER
jgi:transcriptional regulator with XRE-family HTH domain